MRTGSTHSYCIPVRHTNNLALTDIYVINNFINFLHLKIYLNDNSSLLINIYDKRRDFKFHINYFTYFQSCMHISVFRNFRKNHLFGINTICSSTFKNKNLKSLLVTALKCNIPQKSTNSHQSTNNK